MIGILTFNRVEALAKLFEGLQKHAGEKYPVGVFDDLSVKDATEALLTGRAHRPTSTRPDLLADVYQRPGFTAYLGTENLGVAGNTNRCLKVFMESDCDHLVILNDDVEVTGDFVETYAKAHAETGVGVFCFCDFRSDAYKWEEFRIRGHVLKHLSRMTGIAISVTRKCVEDIGFFDPIFGKFGEEHVFFCHRARTAKHMRIAGRDYHCLDVKEAEAALRHQKVDSTVSAIERKKYDAEASAAAEREGLLSQFKSPYRPFKLKHFWNAGGRHGAGIPTAELTGYPILSEHCGTSW